MTDVNGHIELVGEPLQFDFPCMRSVPIAAACIRADEKVASLRIALGAHSLPPRRDRHDGEHGRVVIGANVDEAVIGDHVIYAIRNGLADGIAGEVVHVDQARFALRLPLTTCILEIGIDPIS